MFHLSVRVQRGQNLLGNSVGYRIIGKLVKTVFPKIREAVDIPLLHVGHHIGVLEILRHILHLVLTVFKAVLEVFVLGLLLAVPQILLEYEIDDPHLLVSQVLPSPLLKRCILSLPTVLMLVRQSRVHLHGTCCYVRPHSRRFLITDYVFVIDLP